VGLFLGVVLLCGVFFTLGYVMGKTQYSGAAVHAAEALWNEAKPSPLPKTEPARTGNDTTSSDSPEWDYYPAKKPEHKSQAPAPAPVSQPSGQAHSPGTEPTNAVLKTTPAAPKSVARFRPPRIPRGALILQVAALKTEDDAMALADALQRKKFPAFVIIPGPDSFYHVQVGPYADPQSANIAKLSLDHEGFKAIIKR
jgi:cell division septation protein DedD